MFNKKLNNWLSIVILTISILFLISCENKRYETKNVCTIIKVKHMESESVNIRGDFEVIHYFLFINDDIKEVSLKDYLRYDIGDTLCYNIKVRIK